MTPLRSLDFCAYIKSISLGRPHAIRRRSAHPARQQCGAPRPRRRPQESLWVGSLRGTEVAAFYTLCETARLVGADPRAYLLRAVYAAIGRPGTVTFPEDLLASTLPAEFASRPERLDFYSAWQGAADNILR